MHVQPRLEPASRHGPGDRDRQDIQNRCKSTVCQEDPHLLELTRYIQLNPLRTGLVPDLEALAPFLGMTALAVVRAARVE